MYKGSGQHDPIPARQLDYRSMQQRIDRLEGLVASAVAKQEAARYSAEDTTLKVYSGDWKKGLSQTALTR